MLTRSRHTERSFRHPVFAQIYRAVAAAGERTGYDKLRSSVLEPATGRLLVVGLGPGHDLAHLPPAVTSVLAVEPDPAMRALAGARIAACPVPVALVSADAGALPLADASIDTALCALVLCSVSAPAAALRELSRVLTPGGQLLVLEHVAAPEGHWIGPVQRLVDPLWRRAAGGCSVHRDTRGLLVEAGFDVSDVRSTMLWPSPPPVAPHIVGRARPGARLAIGMAQP